MAWLDRDQPHSPPKPLTKTKKLRAKTTLFWENQLTSRLRNRLIIQNLRTQRSQAKAIQTLKDSARVKWVMSLATQTTLKEKTKLLDKPIQRIDMAVVAAMVPIIISNQTPLAE